MPKDSSKLRYEILDSIARKYLGPFSLNSEGLPDTEEKINFTPRDLYTSGILYPQVRESEELYDENEESEDSESRGLDSGKHSGAIITGENGKEASIDNEEEELKLTTEFNPSSIAISFLARENQILEMNATYGKYYKYRGGKEKYRREPGQVSFKFNITEGKLKLLSVIETPWRIREQNDRLLTIENESFCRIKVIARESLSNSGESIKVISASIINSKISSAKEQKITENCLFQPEIKIESDIPFKNFPDRSNLSYLSEEEIDLKFLYRRYKNYAQGHGCAADWEEDENQNVHFLKSSILPTEKINGVDFNPQELNGNDEILFMRNLYGDPNSIKEDLVEGLRDFVKKYENWVEKQAQLAEKEKVGEYYSQAANRLIQNCNDLLVRMNRGISLINTDDNILKSFIDSNRAMFYQRVMSDFSRHRSSRNRVLSSDSKFDDALPDFDEIRADAKSSIIWEDGKYKDFDKPDSKRWLAKWRPFQLAFILSQIEGIVNEKSEDRNRIDLLWFPTGGGKTEAYLGLIAFNIFYRRITTKFEESGVTVMMRYTLRMLNKQQFSRANVLICACELIRSKNPALYGNTRISNGLWVGGSLTPNKHSGSKKYPGNNELMQWYISGIEKGNSNNYSYSPPVFNCPCCGNKLVKEIKNENGKTSVVGRWGYHQITKKFRKKPFSGYNPFYLSCTNTKCHFYVSEDDFELPKNDNSGFIEKTLPIYYVDEDIYEYRPTLLFSTVDKYAQLAWRNECFRLFNFDDNFQRIANPPSLIVQDELHLISSSLGTIYSLFEFVIDELCSVNGIKPKVVGATATVRNARHQCIKIYNRDTYSQFPPSGIHIDDSFYSRKKLSDPNARLYVGVMPSGFTSTTAKLRLDSLLLELTDQFCSVSNETADNYYTLLAYFNTVKELGKYRTLLEDDMVSYRKYLSQTFNTYFKDYNPDRIIELSSQMNSDDINTGLEKLEKVRLHSINHESKTVKFLNNLGIRSLNDLEDSKINGNWPFSWYKVIFDNWHTVKDLCGLEEHEKPENTRFPKTEDGIKKMNELLSKCCTKFEAELKTNLKSDDVPEPVKVAISTNMISVGVDIPRLNVMSISGQPKTTAEYIQASSRVGREGPGIVFTLYNPAKNRDRSHYEDFKDYHQAYYKYVEATSVTPFSMPALEKTIDSVVLSLLRAQFFKGSDNAGYSAELENKIRKVGEKICDRFEMIETTLGTSGKEKIEERKAEISKIILDLIQRWKNNNGVRFTTFRDILVPNPLHPKLLEEILFTDPKYRGHHLTEDKLFALTSLRDVDSSSKIELKSYINSNI